MATRQVLADLNAAAVAAGLSHTDIESVGGVDAAARVAAGEPFDLVFLALGALQKLAAEGHVVAESVTPLMLSQVAVAVPAAAADADAADADAGGSAPGGAAFADASGMQDALRQAQRIGYSTGPSGTALVAMIEQWGMTAEIGDRLVQAPPGVPVARLVAERAVDLGFQQLSELVGQSGIRILGVLPADCAIDTVFAGAVGAAAAEPAAAQQVLSFYASAAATPILTAHSFAIPAE